MKPTRASSARDASSLSVVVLAGGGSQRLGGVEKTAITIAGRTLLDHAIAAWPTDAEIVVVGPERRVQRSVTWCRESPPGGGPVSAVATALNHIHGEWVAIAAGDAPLIAAGVPELLRRAHDSLASGGMGARAVDSTGRLQTVPCCLLRSALGPALPDEVTNAALWRVLSRIDLVSVPLAQDLLQDVDTPDDLARVRQLISNEQGVSDER